MPTDPVTLFATAKVRSAKLSTEELLEQARAKAADPSIFEEGLDLLFFEVQAASNVLTYYYTRMAESSLKNYTARLDEGVSFLGSHNTRTNGWGQSIAGEFVVTGEIEEDIGEKRLEVNGTFFTVLDLNVAGQSTRDFATAIRSGMWRDVSVGISGRDFECAICGDQMYSGFWQEEGCTHIPGHTYKVEGKELLAWFWVNDADLLEVSQVYDGAIPNAAVLKAEQLSLAGKLSEQERYMVERRYQHQLPRLDKAHALGAVPLIDVRKEPMGKVTNAKQGGATPLPEIVERQVDGEIIFQLDTSDMSVLEAISSVLEDYNTAVEHLADLPTSDYATFTDGMTVAERVAALATGLDNAVGEIDRLQPLAADGESYRADVVEQMVNSGVRAHGAQFNADVYRMLAQTATIEQIRLMRDDFTRIGDIRLGGGDGKPPGGRHTIETDQSPGATPDTAETRRPSTAAYRT